MMRGPPPRPQRLPDDRAPGAPPMANRAPLAAPAARDRWAAAPPSQPGFDDKRVPRGGVVWEPRKSNGGGPARPPPVPPRNEGPPPQSTGRGHYGMHAPAASMPLSTHSSRDYAPPVRGDYAPPPPGRSAVALDAPSAPVGGTAQRLVPRDFDWGDVVSSRKSQPNSSLGRGGSSAPAVPWPGPFPPARHTSSAPRDSRLASASELVRSHSAPLISEAGPQDRPMPESYVRPTWDHSMAKQNSMSGRPQMSSSFSARDRPYPGPSRSNSGSSTMGGASLPSTSPTSPPSTLPPHSMQHQHYPPSSSLIRNASAPLHPPASSLHHRHHHHHHHHHSLASGTSLPPVPPPPPPPPSNHLRESDASLMIRRSRSDGNLSSNSWVRPDRPSQPNQGGGEDAGAPPPYHQAPIHSRSSSGALSTSVPATSSFSSSASASITTSASTNSTRPPLDPPRPRPSMISSLPEIKRPMLMKSSAPTQRVEDDDDDDDDDGWGRGLATIRTLEKAPPPPKSPKSPKSSPRSPKSPKTPSPPPQSHSAASTDAEMLDTGVANPSKDEDGAAAATMDKPAEKKKPKPRRKPASSLLAGLEDLPTAESGRAAKKRAAELIAAKPSQTATAASSSASAAAGASKNLNRQTSAQSLLSERPIKREKLESRPPSPQVDERLIELRTCAAIANERVLDMEKMLAITGLQLPLVARQWATEDMVSRICEVNRSVAATAQALVDGRLGKATDIALERVGPLELSEEVLALYVPPPAPTPLPPMPTLSTLLSGFSFSNKRYPSRGEVDADFEARQRYMMENDRREKERKRNAAVLPEQDRALALIASRGRARYLTTDGRPSMCQGKSGPCFESGQPRSLLSIPSPLACNCSRCLPQSTVWSDVELCIFVDKFLQYPKDFARIASFLTFKTPADVIELYYDVKKKADFKLALSEQIRSRKEMQGAVNPLIARDVLVRMGVRPPYLWPLNAPWVPSSSAGLNIGGPCVAMPSHVLSPFLLCEPSKMDSEVQSELVGVDSLVSFSKEYLARD